MVASPDHCSFLRPGERLLLSQMLKNYQKYDKDGVPGSKIECLAPEFHILIQFPLLKILRVYVIMA